MEYNYSAIALAKRDVAEVDRLYTFFTKEQGRLRVVAKGTRKSTSKNAPHLEDFTLTFLNVAKNHGRGVVTTAVSEESFSALKNNLEALQEVYRARRVLLRFTEDEHRDEQLFDLLKDYLRTMNASAKEEKSPLLFAALSDAFLIQLLSLLGYHFSYGPCIVCQKPLAETAHHFSARHGGVLCAACRREDPQSVPVSVNTIKLLRAITQNTLSALPKLVVAQSETRQLRRATDHMIQWTH